jgi:hypothetical protein
MKPVFQYGAYVGTFGEYHQGAVANAENCLEEGAGFKDGRLDRADFS